MAFVSMSARSAGASDGRELRSFLAGHRKLSFDLDTRSKHDALLHRFVSGATECKGGVAPDYEGQLCKVRSARQQNVERLARVEKLTKKGKLTREGGLLRVHKEVWERERANLQGERKQVEEELEQWRGRVGSSGGQFWRTFLSEAAAEESKLSSERQDFFQCIAQPLQTLKMQLQARLRGPMEEGVTVSGVRTRLAVLKSNQNSVQEQLRREFNLVWAEVTGVEGVAKWGEEEVGGAGWRGERGIPLELLHEKEGTEAATYDTALRELQLFDDHYHDALETLHHQYHDYVSLKDGGWSAGDAERFCHIVSQYPTSLVRRRILLVDRLMRELPHKTRAEIISHETWYSAVTHYHRQLATLTRSWQCHRAQLVQKLIEMLREQKQLLAARTLTSGAKEEQRRRAEALRLRVCAWREERQSALLQEERERTREKEREEEGRRREEEKMEAHREHLKTKLETYHSQRRREMERERREEECRWRELEVVRGERVRRGKERVGHRQQLLRERSEREEVARERAMEAVRRREERLEQLRKTVEVSATRDPQRLLKATKASEMRLTTAVDTQLDAQHPLFTLHGYHDDAVTSDPRFRVAAALQQAGLLDSEYARRVLASLPPSHQPRPDQTSSVFK